MSRFENLKKKEDQAEVEKIYFRHLVVGNDIFSVAKFLELKEKFGHEVAMICDNELKVESLIPRGPTTLRGVQNIGLFKKLYPEISLLEQASEPVFFKEKEWRNFSGRMKPEKLLYQEEFFTESGAVFELADLFPFIEDEKIFENLNELRFKAAVKNVYLNQAPFDLVQPQRYGIELVDGKDIGCENLYWGLGPDRFVSSFSELNKLGDDFIEYCESTQAPSTLMVAFKLGSPIEEMNSTMLIPLSYTHEWGHFIGEFIRRGNETWVEFICFVDPDHSSEQDLVKKIHLLKRHLDKIFDNFSEKYSQEQVFFIQNSPCLKIDDHDFVKIQDLYQGLSFVSYNAPLGDFVNNLDSFEYSDIPVSFFSRGISSLRASV